MRVRGGCEGALRLWVKGKGGPVLAKVLMYSKVCKRIRTGAKLGAWQRG